MMSDSFIIPESGPALEFACCRCGSHDLVVMLLRAPERNITVALGCAQCDNIARFDLEEVVQSEEAPGVVEGG